MKILATSLIISSLLATSSLFAGAPVKVNSALLIAQELQAINQSVQKTQATVSNYTKFKISNAYPATPFQGWQQIVSLNKASANSLVSLSKRGNKKAAVAENIQNIQQYILAYQNILYSNMGKISNTQMMRINTRINLLNAMVGELKLIQNQENISIQQKNLNALNTLITLEKKNEK